MTLDSRIRSATSADIPEILRVIRDLATYEKAPEQAVATDTDLQAVLFPDHGHPSTFCHIGEIDGKVAGIALWFLSFSTWTGKQGIWLEDLFVDPQQRGTGLGKALLASLAQVCVERGLTRLEWCVLNWNTPSIEFYDALGALPQDDWTTYRLDGDALAKVGGARA
ncbi:GNAT family N-acetyltransferase [Leekyejoonella antrihumi]|uniref:GNAT family N-acetyltransferase n=1 Tax=Leekyejoonella antrihumi TaxID=1660198 RepID=A0A563E0C1_9MICO|nr:GNAT family N-acetyltransferase [Leekyejoonella antrihumi]TWP35967.1 GNAT family N-acetyltransferase [Leekyejoonella antrihumi]